MSDRLRDPIDEALARAVIFRTLALGFQPPTEARLKQMGARSGFAAVVEAAHAAGPDAALQRAAARLATLRDVDTEAAATIYWRLFGHTTRGPICACETEYGPDNGFHQPQQLADISGYYLAFGLRPSAAGEARADHVACECEFMDFLNRKEAMLLATADRTTDDEETLAVTTTAAHTFLRDHLGHFGRAFAARVAAEDPGGYFGGLGELLLALLGDECSRTGVKAGPLDMPLRPELVDDTPMACGSSDELIQIQRRR